jgi:hypothetical protein
MIIINKPILTLLYSIKGLCLGKYFNKGKKFQIKKLKLHDNLPLEKRTLFKFQLFQLVCNIENMVWLIIGLLARLPRQELMPGP